jgi:hypothetical protein
VFSLTVSSNSPPVTIGRFTATVTSMGMDIVSTDLTFTATSMDDGLTIRCLNSAFAGAGASEDTCTILVYTIPSVTTALTVTSVTYNSTTLSWTPPTDTGGYPTVNYIIEVTGSNNETIITTDNSIIYTNVECHQTYTFTVRANNSIGEGDPSNTVTVRIPCEVPPQPSNINICLNYTSDSISISWNCPVISNIDTTPPVINYSISVNMVDTVTTSGPVCNYVLPLNGVDDITVNVTANSIAGSSQPISDTFIAELLQDVDSRNSNSSTLVIEYTTVECLIDNDRYIIQLICGSNITSTVPYVTNTTTSFTLQPSPTASCSLQVATASSTIISSTTGTTSTSSIADSVTPTISPTSVPSSLNVPSSSSPSLPPPGENTAAIIGGAIGGVIAAVIFVVIIIFFIICCVFMCSKKKKKEAVLLTGARGNSEEPIALVEKKQQIPETGQPTYQDPNTIERQAAPTGDLYAMPEKPKGRREPPTQPELATYQDPNTIQRQQAPTGDLYALPAQKPVYSEVNKDNKTQGVTYAPLMFDQQQPSSESTRSPPADVVYSDVQRYN